MYVVIVSQPLSPLKDVRYFESEEEALNFVPKRGKVEMISMMTYNPLT